MDKFSKDNGTLEPLIPKFSNLHQQSKNNDIIKSRQIRRYRSAPIVNRNPSKTKPNGLVAESSLFLHKTRPSLFKAALILTIYLAVGMICFFNVRHELTGLKTNSLVDALYFCIVTMTTVGYGDLVPSGTLAKLFACTFVFTGMALVGLLLSGAADYLVEKQEKLLIKAFHKGQNHEINELSKEVQTSGMLWKVLMTLLTLLAVFIIGTIFLYEVEGLSLLDSFYCVCSTVTTLGYGDRSFSTEGGRIFAVIWILVSTLCVGQFFLYLAELKTENHQRLLAHWVLTRKTTVADLEAADMDDDGDVSAAEFIVYKLKEMGKIGEEDVSLVMREFEELDVDCSGTLTVHDLRLAESLSEE